MTITVTPPEAAFRANVDDLGAMARDMFSQAMLGDTAERVLAVGEQTFRCEAAGLLLISTSDQAITPFAASDSYAARADTLQVETHQGPGQQAISRRQPVSPPICAPTAAGASGLPWPPTSASGRCCP